MHQNASFQHQNPTNYSLWQNVLWYCLYSFICTKFSKLILRKIIKIIAKRRQILSQKCTKFHVGWSSAPEPPGGAYSAPPDPLAGFKGPTSKGRGVGGKEEGEGRKGQNLPKKKPGYGLDFTSWYITDCLQTAKSLTIFEGFVAQGQGKGLVNWSSRIIEDNNSRTVGIFSIDEQVDYKYIRSVRT